MPKITKPLHIEITPEQFLNACSREELIEVGLLLDKPTYQTRETEICLQQCTSCEKDFDIETMKEDSGENMFCAECYGVLAPVMRAQYKELVERGEIDLEDYS